MVAQPTSTNRKQAIARALDKAQAQAAIGNHPVLVATHFDGTAIRETWQVSSRTTAGQTYTVELTRTQATISTACTCQAAQRGLICFHRALVRLAAADVIGYKNNAGLRIRPRRSK